MTTISNTDRFRAFSALLGIALAVGVLMLVWGAEPARAAFPGTNGKIAFVSDRNDPNAGTGNSTACEIFVMDPNGSNQTNLTNDTRKCDESPTFSPNGSKIAFNTNPDGNGAEIYVMDADGSNGDGVGDNLTQLSDNSARDISPVFSHRKDKIAVESYRGGD